MGLGGYLTWTAVAREIITRINQPGLKILPLEQYPGGIIKIIKDDMFKNNPYILQELKENSSCFPLVLNNPQTNYCKLDTPEYARHRYDKHIIEQICEFYGIADPQLKCEIYLTDEEKRDVNGILGIRNLHTDNFIVIEPQSNLEYTVNKSYPLAKWQKVVDGIKEKGIRIIQIGRETSTHKLSGVIDLTGKTSFRTAAGIIAKCKLFVSSEGGLMHAANAFGIKSLILYTGFIHPQMTSYPDNINIWVGKDHGPCGMKIKCKKCENEVNNHDEIEIIKNIVNYFNI